MCLCFRLFVNTLNFIWYCFVLSYRPTTGASMNPVRTLGPAVAANNYKAIWVYLTAPILGALCGAGIYSAVKLPEEDGGIHEKPSTTSSFRRWPTNTIIAPTLITSKLQQNIMKVDKNEYDNKMRDNLTMSLVGTYIYHTNKIE